MRRIFPSASNFARVLFMRAACSGNFCGCAGKDTDNGVVLQKQEVHGHRRNLAARDQRGARESSRSGFLRKFGSTTRECKPVDELSADSMDNSPDPVIAGLLSNDAFISALFEQQMDLLTLWRTSRAEVRTGVVACGVAGFLLGVACNRRSHRRRMPV